jgi:hypothetical protein
LESGSGGVPGKTSYTGLLMSVYNPPPRVDSAFQTHLGCVFTVVRLTLPKAGKCSGMPE